MKSLVVGDIHCKINVLKDVRKVIGLYDKVIFTGDYMDDWDCPPEASHNTLVELLSLKDEFPDNVVLLLGNHDLSEWEAGVFRCSGFRYETHSLVQSLFETNKEKFLVAYNLEGFIITHGGITSSWASANGIPFCENAQTVADLVNEICLRDFYPTESCLDIGPGRGGSSSHPSPLWADLDELLEDPYPKVNQIVGHTPVLAVSHYSATDRLESPKKTHIIAVDTFSTYSNGMPLGDGSCLEIISAGNTANQLLTINLREILWKAKEN